MTDSNDITYDDVDHNIKTTKPKSPKPAKASKLIKKAKKDDDAVVTDTVPPKTPKRRKAAQKLTIQEVADKIALCLDQNKAEEIIRIPLIGISQIADEMIVASGFSSRHVAALGDFCMAVFKEAGWKHANIQGLETSEWVLIDGGDIMVHLFKPEIRSLYNLEKLWSQPYQGRSDSE